MHKLYVCRSLRAYFLHRQRNSEHGFCFVEKNEMFKTKFKQFIDENHMQARIKSTNINTQQINSTQSIKYKTDKLNKAKMLLQMLFVMYQ